MRVSCEPQQGGSVSEWSIYSPSRCLAETSYMSSEVTYRDLGSGPPVVLVHAGIADGRMWQPQEEALGATHRLIIPDLRGFGATPLPEGKISHVEDLISLASSVGVERAVWVGCSMGASLLLDLALARPELVAGMVLSNCVPSGFRITDPVTRSGWAEAQGAFERGDLEQAAEIEMAMWLVGPSRNRNDVPEELQALVVEMVLASYRHGEGDHLDPARLAIDHLDEIVAPTLVIAGGHDQAQFRSAAELLAEEIGNARFHIVGDAAHLPSLERPQEFNAIILPFIEGVSP